MNKTYEKILYGNGDTGFSDHDLLSIVLGSSGVAETLLTHYGGLRELERASPQELQKLPGVGLGRIARLKAATLLQQRVLSERACRGSIILCAQDVFQIMSPLLAHEQQEVFLVLPLDGKHRLINAPLTISRGSLVSTVVHPREVLLPLIRAQAVAAILCHNHPSSGDPEPSQEDIELSIKLRRIGDLMQIKILDHLIIGDGCYVSLVERGVL